MSAPAPELRPPLTRLVKTVVEAGTLNSGHIGALMENEGGHSTFDKEFGGVFDQRNAIMTRVTPVALPILMVTHKKDGSTNVRTKIHEFSYESGATLTLHKTFTDADDEFDVCPDCHHLSVQAQLSGVTCLDCGWFSCL